MKEEYQAIVDAGFVLQLDCPDLAMGRHIALPDAQRRRSSATIAELHVEALNHALRDIPPSACACTSAGATTRARTTTTCRCATSSTSCSRRARRRSPSRRANPRHEHEWSVFERREAARRQGAHPRRARLHAPTTSSTRSWSRSASCATPSSSGREHVIAGTDCGFGTFAGFAPVDPRVAWAKLARWRRAPAPASEQLWG